MLPCGRCGNTAVTERLSDHVSNRARRASPACWLNDGAGLEWIAPESEYLRSAIFLRFGLRRGCRRRRSPGTADARVLGSCQPGISIASPREFVTQPSRRLDDAVAYASQTRQVRRPELAYTGVCGVHGAGISADRATDLSVESLPEGRYHFTHSFCDAYRHVVFPKSHHVPPLGPQTLCDFRVALSISSELWNPIVHVARGDRAVEWASVPEAPVDEYH